MPWRSRSKPRSELTQPGGASAAPTRRRRPLDGSFLESQRTHGLGHQLPFALPSNDRASESIEGQLYGDKSEQPIGSSRPSAGIQQWQVRGNLDLGLAAHPSSALPLQHCLNCAGVKITAAILKQPLIDEILTHLGLQRVHRLVNRLAAGRCKGHDAAQARRFIRPGTSACWIRLRPRLRGADGRGLATRKRLRPRRIHRRRLPEAGGLQHRLLHAGAHAARGGARGDGQGRAPVVRGAQVRVRDARGPGAPHVRLSVSADRHDGVRLSPRKAELDWWRAVFARNLQDRVVNAVASRQRC